MANAPLPLDELSDSALLRRFVSTQQQEAFAELVRRHQALVLSVCRRTLGNCHDAEDAFQAAFLVFAQRAHTIRNRTALANWLYGVAYRVSLRLYRQRSKQAVPLEEPVMVHDDPLQKLADRHDQLVTDEEMHRLPQNLREPLVLRYMAGKSNEEVAEQLSISVSAVEGRLKRAKRRLQGSLARRGVALGAALTVMHAGRAVSAAPTLLEKTVALWAGGGSVAPAVGQAAVSNSNAFQLANKEMISMTTLKLSKISAAAVIAACAVTLGLGLDQALSQNPGNGNAAGLQLASGDAAADDDPFSDSTAAVVIAQPDATAQDAADDPFSAGVGDAAADPFSDSSPAIAEPASTQDSRDSQFYGVSPRKKAEMRIRRALDDTDTKIDFFDMPLYDAIAEVSRDHGIQIVLDRQTLTDEGIDPSTPVTGTYRGISLRSALRLLLNDLDLTYVVTNEVLLITTLAEAENRLTTRLYPIPNSWGVVPENLIQVVSGVVKADSWETVGGPGAIYALGNNLVVSQTDEVHEEVHDLLRQINTAAETRRR